MWRAPALDFVVSGGVTYRASDGVRVDRQSSVYAAGEIAHLSYDAQVTTTAKGKPNLLRVRAFRSDPDGGLLGPLKATHFGFGDVEGFDSRLTGVGRQPGAARCVTNRPLTARTAFDRTRIEGDLPTGWEAEIYRNGELLGFAKSDGSQRYVFDDVQLLYGENRIRVVLYGPQGQVDERDETAQRRPGQCPQGQDLVLGRRQPARPRPHHARKAARCRSIQPKAQAAVSIEHGLDARTSVGVLARAMLVDDQRLTFVEGTVRRSIGRRDGRSQRRARIERRDGRACPAAGQVRAASTSTSKRLSRMIFICAAATPKVRARAGSALDAPLKIGKATVPLHGEAHFIDRADGSRTLDAAARLSANIDRFNLGTELALPEGISRGRDRAAGEIDVGLIGSGHIGDVRVRGADRFRHRAAAHGSAPPSCRPIGRRPSKATGRPGSPTTGSSIAPARG